MYRYKDGSIKRMPPTTVEINGFLRSFAELTPEELDEAGYNEAVPLKRDAFTEYTTAWVKGDDLIYREEVVSAVVDEKARAEHAATQVRSERDQLLAESDWTQLADCPLDEKARLAWADYRGELRNIPQQAAFPDAIQWPDSPVA
ncbi:tail fiber assembly protein [Pseudodesulfovibrio sediminis]|uniref:Phage tail assembly chaperone-like domain-containing protein n=1 Tax=Pseudodesulfovibrio sediminis TaxID=2810563 RepID=A0ABN6EML5_9BACT|nr:tail fiber assembly protein [Pseudodesulfovibrio sediminis]BCS87323.1 hypothetical protein PSDVSF_05650 [Pseudodesulfovibrio sediminis]